MISVLAGVALENLLAATALAAERFATIAPGGGKMVVPTGASTEQLKPDA